MHPDGRMDTVSWSDFHLDKMAEDGEDPIDFHIQFIAGNYHMHGICEIILISCMVISQGWVLYEITVMTVMPYIAVWGFYVID